MMSPCKATEYLNRPLLLIKQYCASIGRSFFTVYKLGRGIFEFVFSGVLMGRLDLLAFISLAFPWEYFLETIFSASIQSAKSFPGTCPRFS